MKKLKLKSTAKSEPADPLNIRIAFDESEFACSATVEIKKVAPDFPRENLFSKSKEFAPEITWENHVSEGCWA